MNRQMGWWTTKNEVIKLSDMTTEHIEKCMDMLLHFMDTTNDEVKRSAYMSKVTEFESELNSRREKEAEESNESN